MLPQQKENNQNSSSTIFINPKFKNTHINPNFLQLRQSRSIHINPAFIQNVKKSYPQPASPVSSSTLQCPEARAKIITKTRTKLVREPEPNFSRKNPVYPSPSDRLLKIGTRKLIRASAALTISSKDASNSPKLHSKSKTNGGTVKYKLDRRKIERSSNLFRRKNNFVSKYALNRTNLSGNLRSTSVAIHTHNIFNSTKDLKRLKMNYKNPVLSLSGKKLQMVSINGMLYKSTGRKLQKASLNNVETAQLSSRVAIVSSSVHRAVFVRGNKFILDVAGRSLTRAQTSNALKLKRIDIGGLSFVANSQNVFIRTELHKTRNYLSSAKQKSISFLSRKLTKSNIPCLIYRKLGKCAASERGKCPKVHDKKQISICSKFLKAECLNINCLLSHEVNLSKMPTCKFFLQGCCQRDSCPYLHKKVGINTEICLDFLKGFCQLAEQCNKRHEFLCPDFEAKGKCEKVKCSYPHKSEKFKSIEVSQQEKIVYLNKRQAVSSETSTENCGNIDTSGTDRYFVREFKSDAAPNEQPKLEEIEINTISDDSSDSDSVLEEEIVVRKRPQLGLLPAYIPF